MDMFQQHPIHQAKHQNNLEQHIHVKGKNKIDQADSKQVSLAENVPERSMAIQPNNLFLQRAFNECKTEDFQMKPISDSLISMQPFSAADGIDAPFIQLENGTSESAENTVHNVVDEQTSETEGSTGQFCGSTLPISEIQEREVILEDLTREFTINEDVRNALISSVCDFSVSQLNQLQNAGLRIWNHGSIPPVFESDNVEVDHQPGGSASYVRSIRTIFIQESVNSGYVTHEMAHAWDHIRNLPRQQRVRLESLNSRQRLRLIRNPGMYLTEAGRPHHLSGGRPGDQTQFTFRQMLDSYRSRVPRRELAFSRASEEGYSRTNAQEFYAEGYAVFHGNSENQQAKMYKYARELYIFLHDEAVGENMPVPNLRNIQLEARRLPAPR